MPYEALVSNPQAELRKLAAFLQLPYSEDMVNFHLGKTRSQPGLSAKSAWLPATSGVRDWRVSMGEEDLELFEALAGDCLEDFGYELRHTQISEQTRAKAERLQHKWLEEAR